METSPFTVYLWQQADSLINLFIGMAVAFGVLAFVISLRVIKTFVALISAAFVFAGLGMITPSSRTIAMMYAIPAIVNSEPIQQDLPELYDMAVKSLKDQLAPKQEVEKSK
jgi:uncharacterized membrane protein YccC